MPRSTGSGVIAFGLVSIPVKTFTAQSEAKAAFKQITPDGNKVKQRWTDEVTGDEVAFKDLRKGYPLSKDSFVIFTADELKSLRPESTKAMDIIEMVDATSVDPIRVNSCTYLGPDDGGEKAYALLAMILKRTGKVAVARRFNSRSAKEQLVTIREYQNGLLLQTMLYEPEVRDFADIRGSVTTEFHEKEIEMAEQLVSQLDTGTYDPSKHVDEFTAAVKAAAELKAEGKDVEIVQTSPNAPALDLAAALQASLDGDKAAE